LVTTKEFINALSIGLKKTKEQYGVLLSTKITLCESVFLGQEQLPITSDFI
jgi:hypothetical protein